IVYLASWSGVYKVSTDLLELARDPRTRGNRVKVILQLMDSPSGSLNSFLHRSGVSIKRQFQNFNAQALELPATVVEKMAAHGEVKFVSLDRDGGTVCHLQL